MNAPSTGENKLSLAKKDNPPSPHVRRFDRLIPMAWVEFITEHLDIAPV
jgi:hypothetical protein